MTGRAAFLQPLGNGQLFLLTDASASRSSASVSRRALGRVSYRDASSAAIRSGQPFSSAGKARGKSPDFRSANRALEASEARYFAALPTLDARRVGSPGDNLVSFRTLSPSRTVNCARMPPSSDRRTCSRELGITFRCRWKPSSSRPNHAQMPRMRNNSESRSEQYDPRRKICPFTLNIGIVHRGIMLIDFHFSTPDGDFASDLRQAAPALGASTAVLLSGQRHAQPAPGWYPVRRDDRGSDAASPPM